MYKTCNVYVKFKKIIFSPYNRIKAIISLFSFCACVKCLLQGHLSLILRMVSLASLAFDNVVSFRIYTVITMFSYVLNLFDFYCLIFNLHFFSTVT